MGVNVFQRG